jgi:hypothetical protein
MSDDIKQQRCERKYILRKLKHDYKTTTKYIMKTFMKLSEEHKILITDLDDTEMIRVKCLRQLHYAKGNIYLSKSLLKRIIGLEDLIDETKFKIKVLEHEMSKLTEHDKVALHSYLRHKQIKKINRYYFRKYKSDYYDQSETLLNDDKFTDCPICYEKAFINKPFKCDHNICDCCYKVMIKSDEINSVCPICRSE